MNKWFISVCLVWIMMCIVDIGVKAQEIYVKIGAYDVFENSLQSNALEWIVLEEIDDSFLLLSRYAVHSLPFNDKIEDTSWEESTLRKWLNDHFLSNAFSSREREYMIQHEGDYVSLMTAEELERFPQAGNLEVQRNNLQTTWWLRTLGISEYDRYALLYGDEDNLAYEDDYYFISCVQRGELNTYGQEAYIEAAVRPVIRVNKSYFDVLPAPAEKVEKIETELVLPDWLAMDEIEHNTTIPEDTELPMWLSEEIVDIPNLQDDVTDDYAESLPVEMPIAEKVLVEYGDEEKLHIEESSLFIPNWHVENEESDLADADTLDNDVTNGEGFAEAIQQYCEASKKYGTGETVYFNEFDEVLTRDEEKEVYYSAFRFYSMGYFKAAAAGFSVIIDYRDAYDRLLECEERIARDHTISYHQVTDMIREYERGKGNMQQLEVGIRQQLQENNSEKEYEAVYIIATNYYAKGQYDLALAGFNALGDYWDSRQRVEEVRINKDRLLDYDYDITDEGIQLTKYHAYEEQVVIPFGTYSIGSRYGSSIGAFQGNERIKSVKLPSTLERIERNSFLNCSNLNEMNIPMSVEYIGAGAFEGTGFERMILPLTVKSVEGSAFKNCQFLSVAAIEAENMYSLGPELFYGCVNMTEFTVPEGIQHLGSSCFENCINLESITLPQSLTKIDNYAFRNCASLVNIDIPDGVISIGINTFESCSALTRIELPDNIEEIRNTFFLNCSSLEEIILPRNLKSICANSFLGCSSLNRLRFPRSVQSIYWRDWTAERARAEWPVEVIEVCEGSAVHRFFAEQSMQCELVFYDSQSGEIITKEVKQQTSASKVNVVRVIRDKINLRKEPSSDAEALVRLSSDEDLKVLSIIEDENSYMWYEIDTGKYQGYIRCDLTNVEPDNVQIDNVEGLDRLNKVKNEENGTGNRDIIDVIGQAAGFGGQMQIQVTLNGSDIESVRVLSSMESDEIGKPALEEMCRRIIEANGTEVDFVSGASFSSKAICKAVNRALEQSR